MAALPERIFTSVRVLKIEKGVARIGAISRPVRVTESGAVVVPSRSFLPTDDASDSDNSTRFLVESVNVQYGGGHSMRVIR